MTTILLNEMYPCLQGEGVHMGTPSLLVRLQICNLRCTWCDTPYTHTFKSDLSDAADPNSPQKFKRYKTEDLAARIANQIDSKKLRNLILSGGEPTLQNFSRLLESISQHGVLFSSAHNTTIGLGQNDAETEAVTVEVESNGTQIPHLLHSHFDQKFYSLIQWNISPKGNNAGEKWNFQALKFWGDFSHQHENIVFKFVMRHGELFQQDLAEVLLFQHQFAVASKRICLMPEGTHMESQMQRTDIHDVCLAHGFRYTPRLHVLLFGARRGV